MSKKGSKSSKEPKAVSSYETRDIVLGKVRGFPPWPGMVVDPDSVPASVTKERPGKKASFYCVRFFPTGDYAWLLSKDISKLQTHEIESYLNEPPKKSGELLSGYRVALDPTKWEAEQDAARDNAVEQEANEEVDELESDGEAGDSKKAKNKKRKRESDTPSSAKAKTTSKSKKADTIKKSASKTKRNGAKSKATIESEDEGDQAEAEAEGDDDVGPSKKTSPPPTKKVKRDEEDDGDPAKEALKKDPEALKVRDWRNKLQKSFLSNKGAPKDEDMPALGALFTTVENYGNIDINYLSFSKIGKVMRHIAQLEPSRVPRDDEFHFRERAMALVEKWQQVLNAHKPNGSENGTSAAPPATTKGKEEAVTAAAAALDLNGTVEKLPPVAPADAPGDVSTLADVTMSEA